MEMIIVLCCVPMLLYSAKAEGGLTSKDVRMQKKEAISQFAGMLDRLVRVNERRFEAMKNLAKLEDYSILSQGKETKNKKRNKRSIESTGKYDGGNTNKKQDSSVVVFITEVQKNKRFARTRPNSINIVVEPYRSLKEPVLVMTPYETDDDDYEELSLPFITRSKKKRKRKGKGAKVCIKTCKNVFKNICDELKCKKKMKKLFQKQCKIRCEKNFKKM